MADYTIWYKQWALFATQRPRLVWAIQASNRCLTYLMYGLYPCLLYLAFLQNHSRALVFIWLPAVSFVMVSLVRQRINAPRPYESEGFVPLQKKATKGQSMPSRHVFSATMIAMCAVRLFPIVGLIALLASVLLAVCRVLLGVHYPKDVAVGFLVGILCGSLLYLW